MVVGVEPVQIIWAQQYRKGSKTSLCCICFSTFCSIIHWLYKLTQVNLQLRQPFCFSVNIFSQSAPAGGPELILGGPG